MNVLKTAIERAKSDLTRPSIIICTTKIGYGCPASLVTQTLFKTALAAQYVGVVVYDGEVGSVLQRVS